MSDARMPRHPCVLRFHAAFLAGREPSSNPGRAVLSTVADAHWRDAKNNHDKAMSDRLDLSGGSTYISATPGDQASPERKRV